MIARAALVDEARAWIGTRWQHQQSARGLATDCIGFIAGVANACGSPEAARFLVTPAWRNYGRTPQPDFMYSVCDELMDRVEVNAAQLADVLVIAFDSHPMHFAYVSALDPFYIIHAWASHRCVCEHRLDERWRARVVRAYQIRGVY